MADVIDDTIWQPQNLTDPQLQIKNYIYISHLDEDYRFWIIPTDPDTISDSYTSTFQQNTALGRSAPVYTFSYAGPRTVQIELVFHRELMEDAN